MADSRTPGGKKGAAPVVVFHFPKRGAPSRAPRPTDEVRGPRVTLPELTDDDEPLEDAGEEPVVAPAAPKPARRRGSSNKSDSPGKGRGAKRRAAAEEEPDVRQKAKHLQEVLTRPEGKPAAVSRSEVAELCLFGHHLFERGQLDEARTVFEKVVGLGVEEAFPHTMLGTIFLAQGQSDRALALFEAALALDEGDVAARVYRAEIRFNAGRLVDARSDLELAIKRGQSEDPFVDRARRLLQMVEDRAKRARR